MTLRLRSIAALGALTPLVLLSVACGATHATVSVPSVSGSSLVVLLPDADGGVGRAVVSNASGSVDLSTARGATQAMPGKAPTPVSAMSEKDVDKMFAQALSAMPPAPEHFMLYFKFESDQLTDQSRALLPDIQKAVKARPMSDILVVGHTDSMGTQRANYDLGLKRATTVRRFLTQAGLDASTIDVTSLGEADPLVKTPDDTAEPRNRRVEIAVR